jgi:hypothetical protein
MARYVATCAHARDSFECGGGAPRDRARVRVIAAHRPHLTAASSHPRRYAYVCTRMHSYALISSSTSARIILHSGAPRNVGRHRSESSRCCSMSARTSEGTASANSPRTSLQSSASAAAATVKLQSEAELPSSPLDHSNRSGTRTAPGGRCASSARGRAWRSGSDRCSALRSRLAPFLAHPRWIHRSTHCDSSG